MPGSLERELQQNRPFGTLEEGVVLSLLRTADRLTAPHAEVLRPAKLSVSQYNVLRILRGAGAEGQTCGGIGERMVTRDPDLTRLLDRLEGRGLVSRARSTADRRVVQAAITEGGLRLLDELEEPVTAAIKASLRHMTPERLALLDELLEEARRAK